MIASKGVVRAWSRRRHYLVCVCDFGLALDFFFFSFHNSFLHEQSNATALRINSTWGAQVCTVETEVTVIGNSSFDGLRLHGIVSTGGHSRLIVDASSENMFAAQGRLQNVGAFLVNSSLDCSRMKSAFHFRDERRRQSLGGSEDVKDAAELHIQVPFNLAGAISVDTCALVLHNESTFMGVNYWGGPADFAGSYLILDNNASLTITVRAVRCAHTSEQIPSKKFAFQTLLIRPALRPTGTLMHNIPVYMLAVRLHGTTFLQENGELSVVPDASCPTCPTDTRFVAGVVRAVCLRLRLRLHRLLPPITRTLATKTMTDIYVACNNKCMMKCMMASVDHFRFTCLWMDVFFWCAVDCLFVC